MGIPMSGELSSRADAAQLGSQASSYMNTYLVLQMVPSHFGLPILIATFLYTKKTYRHPTLINVCIAWTLSGIFSVLLLYAGAESGEEPSQRLCRTQMSLLYGAPPMWSVAILTLVYYVWTCYDSRMKAPTPGVTAVMLAAPYVTLAIWSITAGILSTTTAGDNVNRSRRFFYCSMQYSPFSDAMALFTAVMCLTTSAILVRISILFYRNYQGVKDAGQQARGLDFQLTVRILIFGTYIFLGMFFSLSTIWAPDSVVPDIYAASVGFMLMTVFGSQPDIWRCWCFWRSAPPQPVINLSREPSYKNRKFDLDERIDLGVDDGSFSISGSSIGKPQRAYRRTSFSHSVV